MVDKNQSQLLSCLNLMRRLPPSSIEKNTDVLAHLLPEDQAQELYQKIDQIPKIVVCEQSGKQFLACEYNREEDSHRSPWSNEYYPKLEEPGSKPQGELREMEIKANLLFDEYLKLYYEGGIQSTYTWDIDGGFSLCFLVKKQSEKRKEVESGIWNSINIADVTLINAQKNLYQYRLTTTIIIEIVVKDNPQVGKVNISGNICKQKIQQCEVIEKEKSDQHLQIIGRMIEDMETNLRNTLDSVYVGKTQEIIDTARIQEGNKQFKNQQKLNKELWNTMEKK